MYTTFTEERLKHEMELLIAHIQEHQKEIICNLEEIAKIVSELKRRKVE